MGRQAPELFLRLCQGEGFQGTRLSGRAFADEGEAAEVGDQHHSVPFPVSLHLFCPGHNADVITGRFRLNDTARRVLIQERIFLGVCVAIFAAELIGREKAAVRESGATVRQIDDATDLGRKALPDL